MTALLSLIWNTSAAARRWWEINRCAGLVFHAWLFQTPHCYNAWTAADAVMSLLSVALCECVHVGACVSSAGMTTELAVSHGCSSLKDAVPVW